MPAPKDESAVPGVECCQDLETAGFGDKDAEDQAEITTPGVA